VVSTRGKLKEWDKEYKAMANPMDVDIPIVVLVDRNSASASEIVAGSIQDLDRGVIIGRTTYGKGLVQQTVDLSYNSKLKVTVAKYYTPSGRCIQKLNYSDRSEDGKAREIPDSLISEFKSIKYGRPLFDGKGITPDIEIQNETYSNIAFGLVQKNHVFDFATKVRLKNESIGQAKDYEVSNGLFSEFKSYIGSQDFAYETNAEALLDELKASTEEEHYYAEIEKEYHELQHKLLEVKSNDLDKHEQEIKNILASEIVLRYHNQKGQLEYSLKNDPYLDSALSVLGNMEKYNAILHGSTTPDE
jgi:carboxyl-terminal processing protease